MTDPNQNGRDGGRNRHWRLAGAPISWGVCEVPGWGPELSPERVLAEMSRLGLAATELGPDGYLPAEPTALRALLARFDLSLVAGFLPVVLHQDDRRESLAELDRQASLLGSLGAEMALFAPVLDLDWTPSEGLTDRQWQNLADGLGEASELVLKHGLTSCIHPHLNSLVETAADIERVSAMIDPAWCFDTAHLMIGGVDPLEFARDNADRIAHVHLKDVDAAMAAELGARRLTHLQAAERGAFRPLGQGDAPVAGVIEVLEAAGYSGWMVLEQDTSITGELPGEGEGPIVDVAASIEFLDRIPAGTGAGE